MMPALAKSDLLTEGSIFKVRRKRKGKPFTAAWSGH